MATLLVDIELSIPQERILKFKDLGDQLSKTVPEVVELCMNEKCDEYLEMFEKNVPSPLEKGDTDNDGDRQLTLGIEEGVDKTTLSDEIS